MRISVRNAWSGIRRDRGTEVLMEEDLGYIHITEFKLWYPLDALTTAHLTVIVS